MEELVAAPSEQPPPLPPPLPPPSQARPPGRAAIERPFEFHGDAREYFRIWVVNLALGIVTLGLYSAWAKVRSERYFYGNTRLDGVPFEYLAKPWPILKGRLIAFVLFGGYVLAGQFSLKLQLALAGVIALLAPWLLVRGAAFRARYSSWRGLRFRFETDYRQAYVRYLVLAIPIVLTLGLLLPYVKFKQKQFFVERHHFGGRAFGFGATAGAFYPPYLIAWAVMVGWVILIALGAAAFIASISRSGHPPAQWFGLAVTVPMYAGYFAVWAFLAAALANVLYNHVALGPHRFRSSLKGSHLFGLYLGNTLAILLSAGLLIPWAKVRLARYRAESLCLLAAGDLADFRAEAGNDIDATAAEMDGLFDIDIGL